MQTLLGITEMQNCILPVSMFSERAGGVFVSFRLNKVALEMTKRLQKNCFAFFLP
jgi:hypothetical protein